HRVSLYAKAIPLYDTHLRVGADQRIHSNSGAVCEKTSDCADCAGCGDLDESNAVTTRAIFFPFDLFGSAGTKAGAELLADTFKELLADNKRERVATRARAYAGKVRCEEYAFETLADYQDWRGQARSRLRQVFKQHEFLLWVSGNHLGALPVYDELPRDT